jgi:hypothetical protein
MHSISTGSWASPEGVAVSQPKFCASRVCGLAELVSTIPLTSIPSIHGLHSCTGLSFELLVPGSICPYCAQLVTRAIVLPQQQYSGGLLAVFDCIEQDVRPSCVPVLLPFGSDRVSRLLALVCWGVCFAGVVGMQRVIQWLG